ncbi:uncharacterized protein LOC122266141 [Penaeus japonicus]|uniref:uncharacterized protein LOC122266141 n=1 Tax=Penaeus japonicus TaxID=27405 RepID=UPI001C715276|nr:uncharacterized protein LOC122266141 [Penaeus japonicus]
MGHKTGSSCVVLILVSLLRQNAGQIAAPERENAGQIAAPEKGNSGAIEGAVCNKTDKPDDWISGDRCCRCKGGKVICNPKPPKCQEPPANTSRCKKKQSCGCTVWKCGSDRRKEGGDRGKARSSRKPLAKGGRRKDRRDQRSERRGGNGRKGRKRQSRKQGSRNKKRKRLRPRDRKGEREKREKIQERKIQQ